MSYLKKCIGFIIVSVPLIASFIAIYAFVMVPRVPYLVYLEDLTCKDANDPKGDDELTISTLGFHADGSTGERRLNLPSKPCGAITSPPNWHIWSDKLNLFSSSSFIFLVFENDGESDGEEIAKIRVAAKINLFGKLSVTAKGLPIHHDKTHHKRAKIGETEINITEDGLKFTSKGKWSDGSHYYHGSIKWQSEL
ncbi:hypothetical protein [Desulfobacula toluolica]|uniref:Uncharacterized protein n=1 Tax=Desulfobacula toluolica (strain DSM 7467 / Tol2) TaxID=651182 RepID=K0N9W0_DESTT|nr:hypothetical protein [Desulfobacula toluolica]CCK80784.1 uncharacterized protein TOL2_C26250 [Desulfobacula toluolica Tol2]